MSSRRRTSVNTSALETQLHQMAISTTASGNTLPTHPSSGGPTPPSRNSSIQNVSAPPRTSTSLSRRASQNFSRDSAKHQPAPSSSVNIPPRTSTSMSVRKRASVTNIRTVTPQRSMSSLSRKSSMVLKSPPLPADHTYLLDPEPPLHPAPTIVLLHDASYKHRFARPNATEDDLESIVEKPERILAATLGACAAQTRLGQDKITIIKTDRMGSLYDPAVKLVHGNQDGTFAWPEELSVLCKEAGEKLRTGECEVPDKFHQGDLYLCGESKEDIEGCIGAMYEGVDRIFAEPEVGGGLPARRAFVCIRPPGHHCAEDEPSGFCWINNVHIGIAHAAQTHGLTHAAILDFDLHHGDGSQSIAWTINDLHEQARKPTNIPKIGYFSLHDINSYPCEMGDMEKVKNASLNLNAHGQFIHNVHLEHYETVDQFWKLYEEKYSSILVKAKEFLTKSIAQWKTVKGNAKKKPKAAIFLSAGFDASEHEGSSMQRHKVHVPTAFFQRFTHDATLLAEDESTYCDGRVLSVLEGGYSNRAIASGVMAHTIGLATAPLQLYGQQQTPFEESWWSIENLAELERQEKRKKPRAQLTGNYLSATCASQARAVEQPKTPTKTSVPQSPTTVAPPPPPKPVYVDWATAALELSKIFIPEHMRAPQEVEEYSPTESIRPASRAVSRTGTAMGHRPASQTKGRHSVIGVHGEPEVAGNGRVLRERKAKVVPPVVAEKVSKADRRRTVAVTSTPAEPETSQQSQEPPKKASIKLYSEKTAKSKPEGKQRPASAMASSCNTSPPSSETSSTARRQKATATAGNHASSGAGPTRRPATSVGQSSTAPPRTLTRKSSTTSISSTSTKTARRPSQTTDIDALTTDMEGITLSPTAVDLDAVAALEADIARKQAELERARQLQQQQNFQRAHRQKGAPAPARPANKDLSPIHIAAAKLGGSAKSPSSSTPITPSKDGKGESQSLPSPPSSDKGGEWEVRRLERVEESGDDEIEV